MLFLTKWSSNPGLVAFSDASLWGFGACIPKLGLWYRSAWPPNILALAQRQSALSMPFLELAAACICFISFCPLLRDNSFLLMTDCADVVPTINKLNSSDVTSLEMLRECALLLPLRNLALRAEHICI